MKKLSVGKGKADSSLVSPVAKATEAINRSSAEPAQNTKNPFKKGVLSPKAEYSGVEGVDWWWVCDYCEHVLSKEEDGKYFCFVCGKRIDVKDEK